MIKLYSFLLLVCTCNVVFAQQATTTRIDTLKKFDGAETMLNKASYFKPKKVDVSSTLSSKSNLYSKTHLTDKKLSTAWVEGKKGNGIGESITSYVSSEQSLEGIMIAPGYLKDTATWYKNNRVASIRITFLKQDDHTPSKLIPFTSIDPIKITFATDASGRVIPKKQYFTWSEVLLHNMEFTELYAVKIVITAVDTKGSKYEDTCISELSFITEGQSLGY